MRRQLVALAIVLFAVDLLAEKPKFTSSWRSPEASGVTFAGKKVAALVITSDEHLRVAGEEGLARELAARRIEAVPTYRMAPREELTTAERARPWFERAGIQGVVALRPISRETSVVHTPDTWTTTAYSSLWGYYGYGLTSVYTPGGTETNTVLVVETLVYSVPLDRLLWGGISTATNPKDLPGFINELVKEGVKTMQQRGLVK
jgi:hypothetical protein